MADQTKVRIIPGRRSGIVSAPAFNAPQATAATFAHGDPVKLASGVLTAVSTVNSGAASAVTFVKTSSLNTIIGISEGNAAASSDDPLVVRKIADGQTFEGNLVHPTQSSAKLAATNIGDTAYLAHIAATDTKWGFTTYTTSVSSTGSLVSGVVVELIDPASTVNGRVLVEINNGGLFIN